MDPKEQEDRDPSAAKTEESSDAAARMPTPSEAKVFFSSANSWLSSAAKEARWSGLVGQSLRCGGDLPPLLQDLNEGQEIWKAIFSPSADLAEIKARQAIITHIAELPQLTSVISAKNRCYQLEDLVKQLTGRAPPGWNSLGKSNSLLLRARKKEDPKSIGIANSKCQEIEDILKGAVKVAEAFSGLLERCQEAQRFSQAYEEIKQFDREFLLNGDYKKGKFVKAAKNLSDSLVGIGIYLELARILKTEGFCLATYESDKLEFVKSAWSITCPNTKNYRNDSPEETPVTLLASSSMSGKSEYLLMMFTTQLFGQKWGIIPAQEGNLRVYDSISYIDRPSTDARDEDSCGTRDLAAHIQALNSIRGKSLLVMDEPYSATSQEEQFRFLSSEILHLARNRCRVYVASHNPRIAEYLGDQDFTRTYHFALEIDPTGSIRYLYKLVEGRISASAFDIARSLNVDSRLLDAAVASSAGKLTAAARSEIKTFQSINLAVNSDREIQKSLARSARDIFGLDRPQEERFFSALSGDPRLLPPEAKKSQSRVAGVIFGESNWEGSAAERQTITIGDKRIACGYNAEFFQELVTQQSCPLPDALAERQLLFSKFADGELKVEEKISNLEPGARKIAAFLPHLTSRIGIFAGFNHFLDPFVSLSEDRVDLIEFLPVVGAYLNLELEQGGDPSELKQLIKEVRDHERLLYLYNKFYAALNNPLLTMFSLANDQLPKAKRDTAGQFLWSDDLRPELVRLCSERGIDPGDPNAGRQISMLSGAILSKAQRSFVNFPPRSILDLKDASRPYLEKLIEWHCVWAPQRFIDLTERSVSDRLLVAVGCDLLLNHSDDLKNLIGALREIDSTIAFQISNNIRGENSLGKEFSPHFSDLVRQIKASPHYPLIERVEELKLSFKKQIEDHKFIRDEDGCLYYHSCLIERAGKFSDSALIKYWKPVSTEKERELLESNPEQIRHVVASSEAVVEVKSAFDIHGSCLGQAVKICKQEGLLSGGSKIASFSDLRTQIFNHISQRIADAAVSVAKVTEWAQDLESNLDFLMICADRGAKAREGQLRPVNWNTSGEIKIEGMRNPLLKDPVPQNVDLSFGEPVTILNGPNNSGKSAFKKGVLMVIAEAYLTGYAAATSASAPYIKGVCFVDRVDRKDDSRLSAMGNEMRRIEISLPLLRSDQPRLFLFDETFSTIPPHNARDFLIALALEAYSNGQLTLMSSHDHDAIDKLREMGIGIKSGFFSFKIESNGGITFERQLTEGHAPSHLKALAVQIGYPMQILNGAQGS